MSSQADKHRIVEEHLNNPALFKVKGHISNDAKRGIYLALMDLPLSSIKALETQKITITLHDRESYAQKFGKGNGLFRPIHNKLGFIFGNPRKSGRIELQAHERSSWQVRRTARHEIGHAIDWVQGKNNYASLESKRFITATDRYLDVKKGTKATEMVFPYDRSFRRDHLPLYNGKNPRTTYLELAAELYGKYTALSSKYDPTIADQFLSKNYLEAWHAFKSDVAPEVGKIIQQANKRQNHSVNDVLHGTKSPASKTLRDVPDWAVKTKQRLDKCLGARNVKGFRFDDDNNLQVKVPLGFSRRNFEGLGISDPKSKLHITNNETHAIIHIPRQHLPVSLKFNAASHDSFGQKIVQSFKNAAFLIGGKPMGMKRPLA